MKNGKKHSALGGVAGYPRLMTELPSRFLFSRSTVTLRMWPLANPLGFELQSYHWSLVGDTLPAENQGPNGLLDPRALDLGYALRLWPLFKHLYQADVQLLPEPCPGQGTLCLPFYLGDSLEG